MFLIPLCGCYQEKILSQPYRTYYTELPKYGVNSLERTVNVMLNQVVFTRCFPQRDLTNNGKVKRSDGFGVYSMSEELFADDRITNFDFLQQKLSANNGSSETSSTGLFNSYEYFAIAPERYGFIFEVSRPHCKIPRKNGKTHRTGTHIKQCLIGEIEGYPYEWFGADVWSAHLKTENEYYIDDDPNGSPELLPQLPVKPNVGYINVDSIRCFVNDGLGLCLFFISFSLAYTCVRLRVICRR